MAKHHLYSSSAVAELVGRNYLVPYEFRRFAPEVLGWGGFVLISPDNMHKNIVVEEVYLNEWASAHKVRFYNKIPAGIMRRIEKYEAEGGEG